MTKADCLAIVRLLSALESWGFATNNRLPDYLHDDLCAMVTKLCAEILGEASELSAGLGVATLRRKMPPLCYVNTTTLDMAIGFWNAEIPDLYEAVYPEAYVDELLRERNNAEKREYEVLGRANALEAELKAMQEKHDAMTPNPTAKRRSASA